MTVDKFTFEVANKKYHIPLFKDIPMGAIRKSRKLKEEADQVFVIIEQVMGEDSKELAAVDSMNSEAFAEFITSWTQGAPTGESSSSLI
jgi:hypothetical protein